MKQPKKLKPAIWKTLYTAHFLHTMGEPITSKRLAELRGKSRTTVGYHLKVLRDLGVIEPTELSEERAEKGKFGSKPIKLNSEKAAEILRKTSRGAWTLLPISLDLEQFPLFVSVEEIYLLDLPHFFLFQPGRIQFLSEIH